MSKGFFSAQEIYQNYATSVSKRLRPAPLALASLGILAGIYISIGALSYALFCALLTPINAGLAKACGSFAFAIGLAATVVTGAELLTGKFLVVIGLYRREEPVLKVFGHWGLIFILNFIGAALFAWFTVHLGNLPPEALETFKKMAVAKTSAPAGQLVLRAIGCNFLVCLGIWMANAANDIGGKFAAIIFPIFTFVFLGFEHVVANMYFLPVGYLLGAPIGFGDIAYNLFFVLIGNALGAWLLALSLHLGFNHNT